MISSAVMTRAINVPVNRQLMTWNAAAPPADVWEIWKRWEAVHTVRTILFVAAFALETVALSWFSGAAAGR